MSIGEFKIRLLFPTALIIYSCHAFAIEQCPEAIQVVESVVGPHSELWELSANAVTKGHKLMDVAFFDGPVIKGAEIMHDDASKNKSKIRKWTFTKDNFEIFIQCRYVNTNISYIGKIPDGVSQCKVLFNKTVMIGQGFPMIEKVECN